MPILGLPTSMGCWMYLKIGIASFIFLTLSRYGGTALNDYANVRVVDSTGQTFQFSYSLISNPGWSYVTLPVVSANNYWGGANDGIFHLPLRFQTLFLLDGNKVAQTSVVYFTPPVLVSLILKLHNLYAGVFATLSRYTSCD